MYRFQKLAVTCTTISCLLFSCLCLWALPTAEAATSPTDLSSPAPESFAETNPVECDVSDAYPADIRQWCELITRFAGQHDLSPDLIAALIWLESGGNSLAYSRSGAVGLMQVMPRDGLAASFMCVNGPCFASRPTILELEDAEFNVEYGTQMLAGLLNRYGNLRDALKAYGPHDVGYDYADKVLSIYERYRQ